MGGEGGGVGVETKLKERQPYIFLCTLQKCHDLHLLKLKN